MKNISIKFSIILAVIFSACTDSTMLYTADDLDGVTFSYSGSSLNGEYNVSFIKSPDSIVSQEISLTLVTSGFVRDYDRSFGFRQVIVEVNEDGDSVLNAESGVHFEPFENYSEELVIPAGETFGIFPITIYRTEGMANADYCLFLELEDNENFFTKESKTMEINITDQLLQPVQWNMYMRDNYYRHTPWGREKHKFMVSISGYDWDDDFFSDICSGDPYFATYWLGKAKDELVKLNEERAANGLDPLTEADGTVVQFNYVY